MTANWDLPTLGRYDVGAEVFYMVANYTGDFAAWPERELAKIYLNASYPGIFNNKEWAPQPAPNISAVVNGRKVSENIRKMWQGRENTTYRNQNAVPDKRYPPVYRRNKA